MRDLIKCAPRGLSAAIFVLMLTVLSWSPASHGHRCEPDLLPQVSAPAPISQRVKLRAIQPEDIDRLVEIGMEPETAVFIEVENRTPDEYRAILLKQIAPESRNKVKLYAVEYDGRLVGSIGLWFFMPKAVHRYIVIWPESKYAQLGRCLDKSVWNQGVGTEAARQLVDLAFKQMDLHGLVTRTMANNIRARRSIEKAGFKFLGEDHENAYFLLRSRSLWHRLLGTRRG